MLYARLWNKNVHNLQEIVRNKIKERNKENIVPEKSTRDSQYPGIKNNKDSSIKLNNDFAISNYVCNNEIENKIEENSKNNEFIETPKRTDIIKRNRLLSEHDFIDDNDVDDNITEISDDENNEM